MACGTKARQCFLTILYWNARYPGIPALISKRDVKGDFKLIPVSAQCLEYMGCRFAKFARVGLSLFLGWRPVPARWGGISTLPMQYISAHIPKNDHVDRPGSLLAYQYVDDGAFVDPWLCIRPWQAITLWGHAISRCLAPAAAHLQKRQIEGIDEITIVLCENNRFYGKQHAYSP